MDFSGLVRAKKRILSFSGWSKPEDGTGFIIFSCPLAIGGVAEVAFNLHGGCYRQYRDQNVVFELVLGRTATRRRIVLERIEWRSLQGGHSNKRGRPSGIPGRTDPTHWHRFDLNYSVTNRRMIGANLPFADNISDRIQTFEDIRSFAGKSLNIENIDVVTRPEWEYDLFDE